MTPIRQWFRRRRLQLFEQRVADADAELERRLRDTRELDRLVDRLLIESEAMRKQTRKGHA